MKKIKGICLECKKGFEGELNASLCPDCLSTEFWKIDNGDITLYYYAALEYAKKHNKKIN